jgi:iron(II)-dependent oxidoreductase
MSLRIAPSVAAMLLAAASIVLAQDSHFRPDHQQIPTPGRLIMKGAWEGGSQPCTHDEHDAWLADTRHWRDERRIRIGYDGSRYDLPALKWTQSSFFQPQMMVGDRYFYDPVGAPLHGGSLPRARSYAAWAGKRLPHEWEW